MMNIGQIKTLWAPFALILVALLAGSPGTARSEAADAVRGEYIVRAAGCISCHTQKDGKGEFLAGGRALLSPYGTFYSSNITPDSETGIGGWSDADFIHAMRHGESPLGRTYYPAFPYASFSAMQRQDMLDIKAYLFTAAPVRQENRAQELRFPFSWRFSIYPWRWLFFSPAEETPDAPFTKPEERGRYLVDVLGHCAECHTPRNMAGGLKRGKTLAGSRYGPGGTVPNITPDTETGIGAWSIGDLVFFFQTGLKPDGDDVQGEMRDVIEDGLRHLSKEDLLAIATYLQTVPPIHHAVKRAKSHGASSQYDEW
ncbi:MAG: cytochrome c [Proteobacteria bacterium]|nr:cytochrome c [Pseudomonadota bacterium]MDA1355343.1 cytochrome c [Pseudomonadota bacterium]